MTSHCTVLSVICERLRLVPLLEALAPLTSRWRGSQVSLSLGMMFCLFAVQGCFSKPPATNPATTTNQSQPASTPPVANNEATETKPAPNASAPTAASAATAAAKTTPEPENQIATGNYHVDFSLDGRFAVSGGKNATIRMYDIEKGVLLRTFAGQQEPVTSISLRGDASMIAAGSIEGRVATWDAKTAEGLDESDRDVFAGDERAPFFGHEGPVRSLAFRPDGNELASGGEDGTIRYWKLLPTYHETLWNANNSVVLFEPIPQSTKMIAGKRDGSVDVWDVAESQTIPLLPETGHSISAMAASMDGAFVAVGDKSGKLRVVELESQKSILDQLVHEGGITGVKFHPSSKRQVVLTIGADGATRAIDLQSVSSASNQSVLNKFQSKGRLLAVSHGGGYAAVAGTNTVEIADLKSRSTLHSLPVEGKEVLSLAWSAEDRTVVAGDSIGGVYAWRMPGGQKIFDSRIHEGPVRALAGNSNDAKIVSGGADGKIRVWQQPGLAEVICDTGKGDASQLAVSADGKFVAIGATDGSVRIVDVEKKNQIATYAAVGKTTIMLAWSPDAEWLASASADGVVRLWNVPEGEGSLIALESGAPVTHVAFLATGPTLVAGLQNGRFKTWKLPIQKSQALAGHTDSVTSIAGNRSGTQIVTGGNDRVCRLFDVDGAQQLRVFEGAQDGITSVVQASDDSWIAAGDRAGQISMWRTDAEELAGAVLTTEGAITRLASDAANKLLASSSIDGMVRVWQVPFVAPVSTKVAAQDSVVLAISADGRRVAQGLADRSIVIRDTRTGEQIQQLAGHDKAITALSWSVDGNLLASGSLDETIALWHVVNGERLLKWEGHQSPISAVAINSNGEELRACGADGRLAAYTLATKQQRMLLEPQKGVAAVAMSRSGNRLGLVMADGSVQLVNGETGAKLAKTPPSESIKSIAFGADDESWVSIDAERTVKYWKQAEFDRSRGWSKAAKGFAKFRVSADSSRLLTVAADGLPQLRDAQGHVLQTFAWDNKNVIQELALSDDGQVAVIGGIDGTTTVFQSSLVLAIPAHAGRADLIRFAGEQQLISAGEDLVISAWNLVTGTQVRKFEGCPARAVEMTVAKSESKLIVLGDDHRLYVWNLVDGTLIELPPELRGASFFQMGFNADIQQLALLNDQGRLKILRLSDLVEVGELTAPVTEVTAIEFLKNGAIICAAESLAFVTRGAAAESGVKAHEGATVALLAVPHKDEFITAGDDGKIKVWSLNGEPIRTFADAESPIRSAALSDDGTELIVLGQDNKLKTWNFAGESVGNWGLGTRVKSLQYTGQSPHTVVTTTENQIRLYQSTKGKVVLTLASPSKILASAVNIPRQTVLAVTVDGTLVSHAIEPLNTIDSEQREIHSLAVSKNGSSLAGGGEDGSVCVWKLPDLKLICRLKDHAKAVTGVAFGRDESLVVSMSADKSLRVWNVSEAKRVHSIVLSAAPQSLSVSLDGKNVAITTKEKTVSIFEVQSGKPTQSASANNAVILSAQYSPKGLMMLDADKRLSISDTSAIHQFPQQLGPLTSLAVLNDGSYFVTAGPNAGVKLYDLQGKESGVFESLPGPVTALSLSSDGLWLAGYSPEGVEQKTLTVWNVASREPTITIKTSSPIQSAKFEPEDANLVVLTEDRLFRRYRAIDGKLLEKFAAVESVRGELTFHGSGEILTLENDDRLHLYQSALIRMDLAHTGAVNCLTYSANGNLLFSGGADGRTRVWDASISKPVAEFQEGSSSVNDLHVLDNQESVIATYDDNAVRVWPLKRKSAEPETILMHKAPVRCAWTSHDNSLMVCGGADKIVHLWMLSPVRELVQFRGHEAAVSRVVIAADNKTVISFGDEDSIRVWTIPDNATTSPTMGQVDRSMRSVAVVQPQDAEIDRLIKSISAPGTNLNLAEEQRKLEDLRTNRKSGGTQSSNASMTAAQRIDREIQLMEKKIRTSVGQNRNKLRKELTLLKLQKNVENLKNSDNSSGSKLDAAQKELEDFQSGKSLNPVLDWDAERPPGIEASLRSIKTSFTFDTQRFRPVRLAISADKTTIAAARESAAQAMGAVQSVQTINPQIQSPVMGTQIPGIIQLWDSESGSLLRSWKENQLPKVMSIIFSANEKALLTTPDISIYQTLSGATQVLEKNACLSVGRADGTTLIAMGLSAAAMNQTPIVKFFDTDSMAFRTNVINGYDAKIAALAFSPDCKTLYYCERGSRQHKLFEIDVQDTSKYQVIEEVDHPEHWNKLISDGLGIEVLLVSPDKKYLVGYGQYGSGSYRLTTWAKSGDKWSVKYSYPSNQPLLRNNDPTRMWLIKDRPTQLCFEDPVGNVQVIDFLTGKPVNSKTLKPTRWGKPETAHSEDGAWFVWGDDGGRLEVWDTRDPKQFGKTLKAHSGPIVGLALSADGERIVSAGEENYIKVWNTPKKSESSKKNDSTKKSDSTKKTDSTKKKGQN